MLQDLFRVSLTQLGLATGWLYSPRFGGLTYLGAVVVFAVPAAASAYWLSEGRTVRERLQAIPEEGQKPVRIMMIVAIAILLIAMPYLLGSFLSAVLGRVGLFILMGLGLNIVVGYAGLLDLGYVAFFAVGAYTTGVLTAAANSGSSIHVGMGLFEALPIVIVIAAFTGLLIGGPVLRLRGDYLAIVTLGFGEIARVLVTSDWLKPALGGAQGLIAIPAPSFFGVDLRDPQPFYYLALGFWVVAAFVSYRLANSRVGRAWVAMREDEQIAEVMGISTVRYKLLAFATGAAVGSMSGALFAVQIGSLAPTSFNILVSIQALAIIILGGMGSIPGVIVGGLFLVGIPGFLTEFEQFQLLIYGAVLIAIMLYRPEGLIPNVRRTRELHEEEILQDELGEIVSVIGPNGAGKTTLFNTITGLYGPDNGDVRFEGQSIVALKPSQITRLGISRTFQTVHLFSNMTVLENAMVGQHCRGRAGLFASVLRLPGQRKEEQRVRERAAEALSFFGTRLSGYRQDQLALVLSYANRRRLEISRALATEPKLLLLDEPTAGMNPKETLELTDQIWRLRKDRGLTILVIEHDMRVVKGVSDRVVALDYGKKIAEGTYEAVAHNERVIEAYLGRKAAAG